ncbi:MAG: M48 family metalloprotease [Candidatus Omnitrophica bacterium]|nr:M48 family metalloprotease [Candidatus Omnitrophota bacterium]
MMRKTLHGVLALSLLSLSCASTKIENMDELSEQLVLYSDEENLWQQSDELQEAIHEGGFIYDNAELQQYVNDVLDKVVGNVEQEHQIDLRAYLIKDPYFNAGTYPNGVIHVHTSIIALFENEAQLATLLAHEATHFINRHYLRHKRSLINKSAFFQFVDITLAGASGVSTSAVSSGSIALARILGGFGMLATVYGYSRNLETEADFKAFDLILKCGYAPEETLKAYQLLADATKDEKTKVPYFYHTHPKMEVRVRNFERLLEEYRRETPDAPQGKTFAEEYQRYLKDILLDNAELDLKMHRFLSADRQLNRYQNMNGVNARVRYLQGKSHAANALSKLRGRHPKREQPDIEQEADALKASAYRDFHDALALNEDYPPALKELGMLYYRDRQMDQAKKYFQQFLSVQPDDVDAAYIRGYIHEME